MNTPTNMMEEVGRQIGEILKPTNWREGEPRPRVLTLAETAASTEPVQEVPEAERALQQDEPLAAEPATPATVTDWLRRIDQRLSDIYERINAVETRLESKLDQVQQTLR
jgi:hypothetical protein